MGHFKTIIGHSPSLEAIVRNAKMVAATDVTVLIKGETGTGKELFANAIQRESQRADKPFITLNCAALSESLIESELFGHKKGAFTGAASHKLGLFESADGGTVFLDEINSLPLTVQAKLLRFLESGDCLAVGDTKVYHVDVRIISATNVDLNQQVKAGQFRRDLYYRLDVVPLELPPLARRIEDLEHLINHFMGMVADTHGKEPLLFNKSALTVLKNYPWPGNVRELKNLCERLSILVEGNSIDVEHLPREFFGAKIITSGEAFTLPDAGLSLEALEVDLIQQALQRAHGNRSKAAKLLGLTRDTLLYRMRKHGIND